jgi:dTDP-4-dehydrorhamnose 3,5-epimerase-like enzyme
MRLGRILNFPAMGDDRGSLVSLEQNRNIPFEIKRVYYIYDTLPGVERGFHAHRKLQQVVLCLNGSCTFVLDDGAHREEVILNDRTKGLYIDQFIWREMKNFTPGTVLVVLASEYYEESDYIRDYQQFKQMIKS